MHVENGCECMTDVEIDTGLNVPTEEAIFNFQKMVLPSLEAMSPYKRTKYRTHCMSCDRKYNILWFNDT